MTNQLFSFPHFTQRKNNLSHLQLLKQESPFSINTALNIVVGIKHRMIPSRKLQTGLVVTGKAIKSLKPAGNYGKSPLF
jgi:hypothetical protein